MREKVRGSGGERKCERRLEVVEARGGVREGER